MSACEFCVVSDSNTPGRSPFRLVDREGREVEAVNQFLDATALRGLSERTLRTYAFALLSVWKWMVESDAAIAELDETRLAEYIRHLQEAVREGKAPAPRSINLRLVVLRSLYRFHSGRDLPRSVRAPSEPAALFPHASALGARPRRRLARPALRVKVPSRLVVPLGRDEVRRFFESLRSFRDLAIAAIMLFCGLRSREVISLRLDDVDLLQAEIRVHGKGDKDRVLPLPPYLRGVLASYLRIERPVSEHEALFVSLKRPRRGRPMTPAGLRGLFRYHRKRSGIAAANPHRLRHTFAVDMVREGMPIPVLMRILGHSSFDMTMRYVNLSAEDVREELERAVRQLSEKDRDGDSLPRNP